MMFTGERETFDSVVCYYFTQLHGSKIASTKTFYFKTNEIQIITKL